jgi:two-component system nitrogen regulation response regulator GlnG
MKPKITDEFWAEVEKRNWPGNIRELRNAIDHAVVLARGGPLFAEHLPPLPVVIPPREESTEDLQRAIAVWVHRQLDESQTDSVNDLYRRYSIVADAALLNEVLNHTQQNRSAAAKLLGLDRATLRTKLGTTTSD